MRKKSSGAEKLVQEKKLRTGRLLSRETREAVETPRGASLVRRAVEEAPRGVSYREKPARHAVALVHWSSLSICPTSQIWRRGMELSKPLPISPTMMQMHSRTAQVLQATYSEFIRWQIAASAVLSGCHGHSICSVEVAN